MSILITAIILYFVWVLTATRKGWWGHVGAQVITVLVGAGLLTTCLLTPISPTRTAEVENPQFAVFDGKRYLFRGYHDGSPSLREVSFTAVRFQINFSKTLFGWENGSELVEIHE